jgi:hypothetical protein
MLCEKLIHGHREGKLVVDKETGEKRRVGESTHHPYRCGRPAERLRVEGDSFTAFATLCKIHKDAAIREGFKVSVVPEQVSQGAENGSSPYSARA